MKKNKISKKDQYKINRRYTQCIECFTWYSAEELKNIFQNNKLSSTDKQALIYVVREKLKT